MGWVQQVSLLCVVEVVRRISRPIVSVDRGRAEVAQELYWVPHGQREHSTILLRNHEERTGKYMAAHSARVAISSSPNGGSDGAVRL